MSNENIEYGQKISSKVLMLWKVHTIWHIRPNFFRLLSNIKTKVEDWFKFLWPSQNIWTLSMVLRGFIQFLILPKHKNERKAWTFNKQRYVRTYGNCAIKVLIFWESYKNVTKFTKTLGDFVKFLWHSQNIWTYKDGYDAIQMFVIHLTMNEMKWPK